MQHKRDNNTVPYIRFNGISWSPNGDLLTFRNNKIDFKVLNLKPAEKYIKNVQDLQDWVKFGEADDNSKFSRHENKLMEEETDQIVTESFRVLFDWKNMFDMEDSYVLNSINKSESIPYIFQNNIPDYKEHFNTSIRKQNINSQDFKHSMSHLVKTNATKKKATLNITNIGKKVALFNSLKYKVLTQKNYNLYLIKVSEVLIINL